ncbi:FIST signal transduction protein [Dongia deserti]|uniref:FIST signal transduction protein n=1 Tax=Dongia deserti TaxID=2268030 RepID=UPI000E649E0A|nr:FIST N-terminal domain-containing protein [Dongia deserti]
MTRFRAGHAAGADWREAVDACLKELKQAPHDNPSKTSRLGFLYVTDVIAEQAGEVLDRLRRETGVEHWIGATGIGILGASAHGSGEYYDQPAVSALIADLPDDSFRVFPGRGDDAAGAGSEWFEAQRPNVAIVHADPRAQRLPLMLDRLAEASGAYLVGGLASSRGAMVQIAGEVSEGGASGAWIGSSINLVAGLSQGCAPIGPAHVATTAQKNVVMEIDGRPALDVFKEEIGEMLARNLERCANFIYAALPVGGSDTGDYLVRNLMGIDPNKGWIAIGDQIESGDGIMFTKRDRSTANADLVKMLESVKKRIARPIQGGLYFSCLSRGHNLFGDAGTEMAILRDHLGDIPLAGFFANGEISHRRLYGHTGVLALFVEPE